MKESVKKVFGFALVIACVLGLALVGCSANNTDNSGGTTAPPAAEGDKPSTEAPTADAPTADAPAGAEIPTEWQGAWYSKSEIVPPEQETDQYSIEIDADGSFVLKDGDADLYTGVLKVTDEPEAGWGEATVDGKTLAIQLVNAQGIYKFIFNAGDEWDKDFKKIVFQR
jgi:hypothetical protein